MRNVWFWSKFRVGLLRQKGQGVTMGMAAPPCRHLQGVRGAGISGYVN